MIKNNLIINSQKQHFDLKYIYDVFHNDNNKLIIIMPAECNPPLINYIYHKSNIQFKLYVCPHKHTYIYEALFKTKYIKNIQLFINGNIINNINVNKYPEFKNEIIMSTIVLHEDTVIRQWIKFHIHIGITRFIIYDNSWLYHSKINDSNLVDVLDDYIKQGIVIIIRWPYSYKLPKSGISGQTTQQNHSIKMKE